MATRQSLQAALAIGAGLFGVGVVGVLAWLVHEARQARKIREGWTDEPLEVASAAPRPPETIVAPPEDSPVGYEPV